VSSPVVPRHVRWFRSAGRRRTFALATSLAVHAAALLLLLGPAAPPPLPPDAEPIAVEFIESPPAPPVAPPEPPAPSTGDAEPAPSHRRPSTRNAPAPSDRSGEATAEATPEPGTTLDMRFPPASLLLDHDAVDRLTRDGVIDRPQLPPGLPGKRPRGPSFSERLAARVRDDAARDNVERGNVHPQAYDYMRGAQRLFRPDPELVYRDERAPNTIGRSAKQWAKGAFNAIRPWKTVEEANRQREMRDPHRQGPADIFRTHNAWLDGTEQAARPIACLVCLVIRPGETARVELAASSGNKEVDRAAVEALERVAERRPTDQDVRNQRSCYRFTTTIHRIPPVPIVGCNFDEAALRASCYYPTKKVTKTDVKLESVDYDG
jgi:hypothetical protein